MDDLSNLTLYYDNNTLIQGQENDYYLETVEMTVHSLISIVTVPLLIMGIYGLCHQVRSDAMPVFVINLFACDLIFSLANLTMHVFSVVMYPYYAYITGTILLNTLIVNIFLMVCISAERYMMIAHPIWYRNAPKIMISVIGSLIIWITVPFIVLFFCGSFSPPQILLSILLLPFPLVVFFFFKTRQTLSKSTSVSQHDQRRILGILALVLCIYTFLYLPFMIIKIDEFTYFVEYHETLGHLYAVARTLFALNPLFDIILYFLIRKDAKDLFLTPFCCFGKKQDHRVSETTNTRQTQI